MGVSTGTVESGGVRLTYRDHAPDGDLTGVPVVVLHGLASGKATWDRFAGELLDHGRRTIAPDARGHGESHRAADYSFVAMRDDVIALIDRLGLWKVDLVGHSMGGHVASLVAMHAPYRVRRLLLEDTPPPPPDELSAPATGWFGLARFGSVVLATRTRQFDVTMATRVITELRTPDPAWWEALTRLEAPTLLLRGGPGSHVPGEAVQRVADALPHCRVVTVERARHRIHSRRPVEFARIAVPFITIPGRDR